MNERSDAPTRLSSPAGLTAGPATPDPPDAASTRRLLFIAHRLPFPPDKGERLRAFGEIRALGETFDITLAASVEGPEDAVAVNALRMYCSDVILAPRPLLRRLTGGVRSLLRGRSATEGYFAGRAMTRLIRRAARGRPFDVAIGYCSATARPLLAAPARVRVMDLVDVDSAKWAAYAAGAAGPQRWLYATEARRVGRLERRVLRTCDRVVLVSQAEAAALNGGAANVLVVGNGVDLEYFTPTPLPSAPSLVFTGTMDYRPNVDGVCWFVREVWGEVRRVVPSATFTIVGRHPTAAVRALDEAPGVTVTGAVPDVRPYLVAARAAVAPLQIARGIQNKVLEAMAAGRPVVATREALEGLEMHPGVDVLQADTPEAWRAHLAALLADDGFAEPLAAAARRTVTGGYSWSARMDPLVRLCEQLAADRGG
ncbi:MAG: TIGR03087 family PEP-CTERM/XrtA system glycosyltransferase [Planctomycetota bacterium]